MGESSDGLTPLPDPAVCRTRYTGVAFTAECLVVFPQRCEFAEQIGDMFFCCHPDRFKFDKELQKQMGRPRLDS